MNHQMMGGMLTRAVRKVVTVVTLVIGGWGGGLSAKECYPLTSLTHRPVKGCHPENRQGATVPDGSTDISGVVCNRAEILTTLPFIQDETFNS